MIYAHQATEMFIQIFIHKKNHSPGNSNFDLFKSQSFPMSSEFTCALFLEDYTTTYPADLRLKPSFISLPRFFQDFFLVYVSNP